MLDICEAEGCGKLVDSDGYVAEVHGPLYCDHHQPRCLVCGYYLFKDECWNCDNEAGERGRDAIRKHFEELTK